LIENKNAALLINSGLLFKHIDAKLLTDKIKDKFFSHKLRKIGTSAVDFSTAVLSPVISRTGNKQSYWAMALQLSYLS